MPGGTLAAAGRRSSVVNAPALLVAAIVSLGLGCSTSDATRERFAIKTLERRATHLANHERKEIAIALLRAEERTGVDLTLLLAVAEEESHFRREARSRRGALGLLQVKPTTGRDVAQRNRIGYRGEHSLLDPSVNALVGAHYLAELRERFDSWDLALTAYNHGPTRAQRLARRGRSPSSRYAERVMRRAEKLRKAALNFAGK